MPGEKSGGERWPTQAFHGISAAKASLRSRTVRPRLSGLGTLCRYVLYWTSKAKYGSHRGRKRVTSLSADAGTKKFSRDWAWNSGHRVEIAKS